MSNFARMLPYAALIGAGIFAGSLAVQAAGVTPPAAGTPAPVAAKAAESARETIEQRITSLHESLKITAGEEANWNGVTKAMRDNAVVMEKLSKEQSAKDPAAVTAVEDLKTYEKFSQAHVDGLKSLTASFEILYKAMPASQQKIADKVFQDAGHHGAAGHA